MPRAFCPECGSEVPVDADGVCHVGHLVDVDGASVGPEGDLDATFSPSPPDPDEPQPWVASVDPTTLGGFTEPPPSGEPDATPDAEPWTPQGGPTPDETGASGDETGASGDETGASGDETGASGDDDLAAAAAAAIESLRPEQGPDPVEATGEQVEAGWPQTQPAEGDAPGWTPPTNDPVTPPPVPAPAPADPPAPVRDEGGPASEDFDLDDLATAVSDLDMDDDAPPVSAGAAPTPTQPVAPVDGDVPPAAATDWEDELGEPTDDTPRSEREEPGDPAPVDLGNFTAKGGKAKEGGDGGKKGGLFRRR